MFMDLEQQRRTGTNLLVGAIWAFAVVATLASLLAGGSWLAIGGGAAVAAVEPAGGAEARSGGGRGAGDGGGAGA